MYNFNWEHLSVSQQKDYILFLRRAQQDDGLTVGKVIKLNVETGLEVNLTRKNNEI